MKNIKKEISLVQSKLKETEESYQNDQESLKKFSDKLVGLVADNLIRPTDQRKKEIEGITDQITKMKNEIELTPRIISALKEKIALLEKEKADQILQGKIEEQKTIGAELAKISGSFIKNLKLAKEENEKIGSLWANWNKLKEETGFGQFKDRVSCGSSEMLGLVSGILIGEYEKNIIRKQSVFNRIRL